MKLINPAVLLMKNLKYPQKFSLISCIFALPLILLMYLLLSEINSRIDFARKEIYGNQYLRPLRQLREHISQHQITAENNHGEINQEIDINFNLLKKTDKQLGQILSTNNKAHQIKQDWQQFQLKRLNLNTEQANWKYQSILNRINDLSAHVGDTSNLILDPDLDTYYLMDASLLKLPEMQKILVEIRLISKNINMTGKVNPEDKAYLITLAGRLQDMTKDLARNMEVAFTKNPAGNLRPALNTDFQEYQSSTNELTAEIQQLINPNSPVSTNTYIALANQNLDISFELWDKVTNELDILLQRRIDGFVNRQLIIIIFILIIVAVVIYLFTAFYLGVMQTVSSLKAASQQMVTGELSNIITLDSKDELAHVVHSFNNIAAALVRANQENMLLNKRLETENMRMSAELEVTRKLQQMLLPKEKELSQIGGLEIAGFMEPASEVGGDYYDVLQNNGTVKIGIGDVTGHGLESGVLMIMVQTAVRTLLENNETNPVKFLNALNRTIYDNVQRMNSDKNLTLMLLDYQDGKLRLSGQHEEMVVVRAGGKIERIDTMDLGFPIGLESDISDFIAHIEVELNQDDVVVLYTDGITEAENQEQVQYGLDRLCKLVSHHRQNSAAEIRQMVINDVRDHIGEQKIYDDITLLVLKQK